MQFLDVMDAFNPHNALQRWSQLRIVYVQFSIQFYEIQSNAEVEIINIYKFNLNEIFIEGAIVIFVWIFDIWCWGPRNLKKYNLFHPHCHFFPLRLWLPPPHPVTSTLSGHGHQLSIRNEKKVRRKHWSVGKKYPYHTDFFLVHRILFLL